MRRLKVLYITTVGSTMGFFKDFIRRLLADGHLVDISCNISASDVPDYYKKWGCCVYPISCTRFPLNIGNIKAIDEIKRIVSLGEYDIVHCHTPIAATCTRLACRNLRKKGLKVIYTAHGFHFYKGAPVLNWLVYYPIEKLCAHLTDVLITINKEDYSFAQKRMKVHCVKYVPGMGVDIDHFSKKNTAIDKRYECGIPKEAFLLISVGELNKNKNHEVIIRAIAELQIPTIHYAIAGQGPYLGRLISLASELGLSDRIHFLGYRNDVSELYASSNVCCFPSIREGLGLAAIEGMASGLPLIVADNRGTRDYCKELHNGFVCDPRSVKDFASAIEYLFRNDHECKRFGEINSKSVDVFDKENIIFMMMDIYNNSINNSD